MGDFIDILNNSQEEQRIRLAWKSAGETVTLRSRELSETSITIAKDKAQYFEKIALGSAGAIAALVSFLGSHASHLQPRWLLRTTLISLALTTATAMLRNWIYPFYLFSARALPYYKAQQENEGFRRDYIVAFGPSALEDGQPIDADEWVKTHQRADEALTKEITRHKVRDKRSWFWLIASENTSLSFAAVSMLLLVLLAWWNF